ncbi:branched-chain amino acid ABC transporter permease/ATP-binding protein [Dactylosporangium sp. NPDC005572]|uniref:branched-chain amino acid ABC transporter permease/ATP-binding protein n=1 Tax=Dactylosporangium sp. NPDC005572 TaxID=3156889 RepID=UPI0033B64595
MTWLQYSILGLGSGAAYALLAQGILLIYRGSGIVNFSHGGFAMLAAYIFNVELRDHARLGVLPSFLITVALVTVIAGLVHPLIMRPLRNAAPIIRIIATLGILIVLQASATLVWGSASVPVLPVFPSKAFHVASGLTISADRLILVAIALIATAVLYGYSRFTMIGVATRAAAENQRAASALGWSPDLLATANWAMGGALASAAGILITPYASLDINVLTMAVISAMAAALMASFRSFPIAMLAGLFIGVVRSLLIGPLDSIYHQPGAQDAVPFLIILAVLVFRGRGLPVRGSIIDRLPSLGTGVVRARVLVPVLAVVTFLVLAVFSPAVNVGVGISVMAGIVMLSVVVLTGFTGQLSLAQYALAGLGALFAARIGIGVLHWPFTLALVIGVLGAAACGVVFALPALRTRGVNLAVITLGLGLAVQSVIFSNPALSGGYGGLSTGTPEVFGISLDPILSPQNYTLFAIACFAVVAFALGNLRRGQAGRRLISVRANERAAAALGVNVTATKIYAFALSAGIAGLGGALLAFQAPTLVVGTGYTPIESIQTVGLAVAGGVGYLIGPLFGGMLQNGGLGTVIGNQFAAIDRWVALIGGLVLLQILLTQPDGQAGVTVHQLRSLTKRLRRGRTKAQPVAEPAALPPLTPSRVAPRALQVRGLSVRFGGVLALDSVSLDVEPGQVVGLMGPNGAGKTTLIDAVSGFVRPTGGTVRFAGEDISRFPAFRRTRAGLSRSFQSLELFDDISVRDNLLAAADSRSGWAYVTDLLWHFRRPLPSEARAAIRELGLLEDLDKKPTELPFGRRRLVAIARAIAAHPSVVLLDEPGSGLDENESAELGRLIRRLAETWGIGVLLIEHDVQMLLDTCDHIVVLDFGRQIAAGAPAEVRTHPAVLAAYLGQPEKADPAVATADVLARPEPASQPS